MIDSIIKDSQRANEKSDCTVRALALAANIEYPFAWALLSAAGRRSRSGSRVRYWSKAYKAIGLFANPIAGVHKMSDKSLIGKGDRIVLISGHIYTVRDGMTSDGYSENLLYNRGHRRIVAAWKI